MAATIARATGYDSSRAKETHRLGSQSSTAQANTWQTFATAHINRDGSGYIEVRRDGKTLHRFDFGPEGEPIERTARERAAALLTDTDISGILAGAE